MTSAARVAPCATLALWLCLTPLAGQFVQADDAREPLASMLDRLERNNLRLNRALATDRRVSLSGDAPSTPGVIPSDNSRIRVTVSGEEITVADVTTLAQRLHSRLCKEWNVDAPHARRSRIVLHVTLAAHDDTALTLPPLRPDDPLYRIRISSPDVDTLRTVLAHELTHVVLHTRFGDAIPPWFDEGIASREDAPHRVRIRQEIIERWIASGRYPAITKVIHRERIAAGDVEGYAVATSLVEFLHTRLSHSEVEQLIDATITEGWGVAVRRTGSKTDVELEQAWSAWLVRSEQARLAAAGNRDKLIR